MAPDTDDTRSLATSYLDQLMPGAFPETPSAAAPGVSTHRTLSAAVHARRGEYTRPRDIRIKVGTWNVAAADGTEKDIKGWFVEGKGVTESLGGLTIAKKGEDGNGASGAPTTKVEETKESPQEQESRRTPEEPTIPINDKPAVPGGEEIGIYVLGLQEIVDVSSPTEALRPYTDPTAANRYKTAMQEALPSYQLVAEQQLVGLLLLVYASPSIAPDVKSVSTTSVGTGIMGYMGNKGGVTARIVLGETTRVVFINAHLAAGTDKTALERRNWDAGQISTRTRFDPITDSMGVTQQKGEALGDEDFAFWFGDLNYRLEGMPGDDIRYLLTLHTRNEYRRPVLADSASDWNTSLTSTSGSSSNDPSRAPSSQDAPSKQDDKSYHSEGLDNASDANTSIPAHLDPTSLLTTLSSLLPHDELRQQQKSRKAFHDGWREGPIQFLPTYKYDVGSVATFDSSEKKRCPSWCDRILFRTRRHKLDFDETVREEEEARKRDEEMKARGIGEGDADDDLLYDYNPETDGEEPGYGNHASNEEGYDYDDYDYDEAEAITTKEGFEDEITLEYYTSHQRVISSDHKPLGAIFKLKYDAVDPDLKARVHQEVVKELDRAENEGRPAITLIVDRSDGPYSSAESKDPESQPFEGVDFGNVRFAHSKRRNVIIANTGQVPAIVGFVDRPVEKGHPEGPAPPWLSIIFDREPDKKDPKAQASSQYDRYTLEPGDTCNVELVLRVEIMELVRSLNASVADLEDILVLRVENGRDHFLPIRGRWLQSSLGRSIDKLIRIPEGGIRKLQGQKPKGSESDSSLPAPDPGVMWSAPRELFRLTESIEDLVERVIAEWQMTHGDDQKPPWQSNAGWPFAEDSWTITDAESRDALKGKIYEALDCDQPFEKAFDAETPTLSRLEILAETLLVFLRSLEDGIVPSDLWAKLEDVLAAQEKSKQQLPLDEERIFLLEILSQAPTYNVSFVLLTTMLQRVAQEIATVVNESRNKSTPATPTRKRRESMDLPTTPKSAGTVRKNTLSQIPEVARRQLVDRSLAAIFADAMIRVQDMGKGKERDKRKDRMIGLIEIFLKEA